jgi:rhodanese-related sulfurtransferase
MSASTITTISTADFAQRFADDVGLHVWNVLNDDYFKGELIPGSRRVPADRLGEVLKRSTLAKDASIVVYCAGPSCPVSRQAAEKLAAFGYTRVEAYEGGLEEWKHAGYGVVRSHGATA